MHGYHITPLCPGVRYLGTLFVFLLTPFLTHERVFEKKIKEKENAQNPQRSCSARDNKKKESLRTQPPPHTVCTYTQTKTVGRSKFSLSFNCRRPPYSTVTSDANLSTHERTIQNYVDTFYPTPDGHPSHHPHTQSNTEQMETIAAKGFC